MICTNLDGTAERFHMRVSSHVSFKVVVWVERFLADRTLFCLFPIVQLQMLLQQVGLEELEVALWTLHIDLQLGVLGHLGNNSVLSRGLILSGTLGTSQLLLFGLLGNFTPHPQCRLNTILIISTILHLKIFLITWWKNLHEAGGFVSSSLLSFGISGCCGWIRLVRWQNTQRTGPGVDSQELCARLQKYSTL